MFTIGESANMTRNDKIRELFMQYYRPLCIFATNIVGDIDTAEDIVMEQFTKYIDEYDNNAGILSPEHYMRIMTKNACIDYVNQNKSIEFITEIPDIANDDEVYVICEREARLWTQIDALPPVCRRILLMSKRDDMTYQEISNKLGISTKTVEAHLRKAYAILRGKAKEIYAFFFC
jgi:RNA polymerase sigma-70 factor (ECF subfamily)